MPQAPRKDPTTQRVQDKESKRARGALSCAECRRLKLKCDKTVPCSSCKRRGCSEICPNGSLITGQGTRFVLADTEKLHQKISQMSDRIRRLEDALAVLQSTQSTETHPLLDRELLNIKSSVDLHSAGDGDEKNNYNEDEGDGSQDLDSFGTLAIRTDGANTFFGRSAGSESLLIGEAASSPTQNNDRNASWSGLLPDSINALASGFPHSSVGYDLDVDTLVTSFLPSWEEAVRLCQLYLEQAPWFFGAVTSRQIDEEILPTWYAEATPQQGKDPMPLGSAHDLALLFVIFCFGALTDMDLPAAPENVDAERYFHLTKAALSLEPVLDRPPSVATVQALSMMAIYEGICSREHSIESTWSLMGLATKLAQSIGLHRDCARFKLPPAEVQKRRALFWELFITDCWQSLATGRLATFSLPFVDCELPFDSDQTIAENGTVMASFPFWKARFGAECVSAVVQGTQTSRAPKYAIILELDRKVRDMELPLYAQGQPPQGVGLAQTMSHFMPTNYRELTLLYIHRCFFSHAVTRNPLDPIKSQYAPSFLAGYRSACTIVVSVKQQFSLFPAQIARFWVLWTHAFSAAFMLASVATYSPLSKVAPAALLELKNACDLFESAAQHGGRAVKFLPVLKRAQAKAQRKFREANSGITHVPNDIFKPSSGQEEPDELSIFSGKTYSVTTKASGSSSRVSRSSPSASNTNAGMSSRASSDSPKQPLTENLPSFAGVHPNLVNDLSTFEGHIRESTTKAFEASDDVFGGQMLVDDPHQLRAQQLQHRHYIEQQELARQQGLLQQQQKTKAMEQHQHGQQQSQYPRQSQGDYSYAQQSQQHYPVDSYPHVSPSPSSSSQPLHTITPTMPPPSSIPSQRRESRQPRSVYQGVQQQQQQQQYHGQVPQQHSHQQHPVYVSSSGGYPPDNSPATSATEYVTSPVAYAEPSSTYYDPSQRAAGAVAYSEHFQYWPTAPGAFMTLEQQGHPSPQYNSAQGYQPYNQPYTPTGALRGIAAEDVSLQETWQNFQFQNQPQRFLQED